MDQLLSSQLGFPTPTMIQEVFRLWEPDPQQFIASSLLPTEGYPIELVEWDIYGPVTGMTNPTTMGVDPVLVPFKKQETVLYKTAHWKDTLRFDESDFLRIRRMGTINQLAGQDAVYEGARMQDLRLETRLEYMRWGALSGTLNINENGINRSIDYRIPAGNKVTAATPWNDTANAKPIEDIQAWTELGLGVSNGRPTMYMNVYDVKFLSQNAQIRELIKQNPVVLNLGRDTIQQVFPQLVGDLESIVVYRDGFLDAASGHYTPFIPKGKVFLVFPPPRGQRLGAFKTTPSVHNGGFGNPQPGKFVVVEDKSNSKNPIYDMTVGIYGLPVIYFPQCVVPATIYTP